MVVVVQVRTTHAARCEAERYFAWPWLFGRPILNPKILGGMNDDSFHQSTGVGRFWPAKWAVRLSRISCPMAFRVSIVPEAW